MTAQPQSIRTFRATDPRSALAQIKAAFGSEAVILSTRQVGGGIFGRSEIEITAAMETPPPEASATATAPANNGASDALQEEIRSLRQTFEDTRRAFQAAHYQSSIAADERSISSGAREVQKKLCRLGFDFDLAEELIRSCGGGKESMNANDLIAAMREKIGSRLKATRSPFEKPKSKGRRIVALVGPTGVGKTTTIAKIAARSILGWRANVALVTIDTFRIGAREQLQRYGEIMKIPTHVARDRVELKHAMDCSANADLVLIDSAGRSSTEDIMKQAQMLRSLNESGIGVELHLVLSAGTGAQELRAVSERYRPLNPEEVIISKLDEATGPGGILSAVIQPARPISCIANGQRVPEDLHSVTDFDLVDVVFGNWKGSLPNRGTSQAGYSAHAGF